MLLQFEGLTANSRYEVIVQSKNRFGWSEPAKSFLFTTRLKGKDTSVLPYMRQDKPCGACKTMD